MSTSSARISLSADEKKLYGRLFKQGDPEGLGIVTGEVARTLFERSGLPPNVLGEIWQIADTENQGFLDQVGFSLALRIVGKVQAGEPVSPALADTPGPLPSFDGRQRHPESMAAPIASPAPISGAAAATRVPPLNSADRARFIGLFTKSAPSGVLDGERARAIFLKARLSNETLGQIWNLADTQNRGQLNQSEFVVAMHLIQCTLNGSLKQLPPVMPQGLFEAASGRPTARYSPRVSSQGMARQYTGGSMHSNSPQQQQQPEWTINPQERARFDSIFNSLDKSRKGLIGAEEVVPFLTTSKLPEDVLAQVWDLSDVHNTGQFSKSEFSIAMYLIQQKLQGKELPLSLPQSVLLSATSNRDQAGSRHSSVASLPTGAPNVPNPVFFPPDSQPPPGSPGMHTASPQPLQQTQLHQSPPPSQQQQQRNVSTNTGSMSELASLNDLFASPVPAAQNEQKQFVPTSSFGQSIARQNSGQVPSGSPSPALQPPPQQVPAQLTGQRNASASRDLLADNDTEVSNKLSAASTEFGNLSNQISSLTTQTVSLTEKREKAEAELARITGLKKDIEGRLSALRSNYDEEVRKVKQVEEQLEASKQETDKVSRDYNLLEASYHALQSQYAQVSSQLASDQERNATLKEQIKQTNDEVAKLKVQLEQAHKDAKQQQNIAAVNESQLASLEQERSKLQEELSDVESRSREVKPTETQRQQQPPQPPQQAPSPGNPFFNTTFASASNNVFDESTEARQRAFEETFGQMELASPSTVEPAPSSTQNTVETPSSSPPASEFAEYNENQPPTFTLPIARPQSATSSVQNNAPLSVREDLDVSRPESPAETTTEQVSGIVPPAEFEHQAESSNQEKDDHESSESFEMVEPVEKTGTIPGSFPSSEPSAPTPQSDSTAKPPSYTGDEEESSSDEEGPEDLEARFSQRPQTSEARGVSDDFTSAPSSPADRSDDARNESTPKAVKNDDDLFASAFSDLTEAKVETTADDTFPAANNNDFKLTFDDAFAASPPTSAPTNNDEWEQLFAGFSNSGEPAKPSTATAGEINDAFSPRPPAAAQPTTLTPHSQAVEELTRMGFSKADAIEALEKKNYNLAEASNYLLDKS
ncbi:EH domain-containing and endocytosis protein 1 [Trichomonascus vanleenenianus]|uniref:Ede1p n=1 Tax=Trichomonascus vanleenenianus TaxID=2268995 RepID=UPI003ECAFB55